MSATSHWSDRRGFALLTVLWLLAALSVLAGASLALARRGTETTRNRIVLARAAWAREACAEMLLARYAEDTSLAGIGPVDLGRGTWCRATLDDPAARLNLNLADAETLRRVIGNDTLADALLDWRDPDDLPRPLGAEAAWYAAHQRRAPRNDALADVDELGLVRGFDSLARRRLAPLLTTRGSGHLNVNRAAPILLATLPGVGAEAIDVVRRRRETGRPLRSADEWAASLSPSARQELYITYQELLRTASFAPAELIAAVEGGVTGYAAVARATLTLTPVGRRLAVIRREVE